VGGAVRQPQRLDLWGGVRRAGAGHAEGSGTNRRSGVRGQGREKGPWGLRAGCLRRKVTDREAWPMRAMGPWPPPLLANLGQPLRLLRHLQHLLRNGLVVHHGCGAVQAASGATASAAVVSGVGPQSAQGQRMAATPRGMRAAASCPCSAP
jgi:hypothetical protein